MRKILPSRGAPAWTTLALLFGTAALLLLISSVVLGVLYGIERNKKQEPAKTDEKDTVCSSAYCIKAANYLLESIDDTVDPCDDFYAYSCGKWMKNAKIPSDGTDITTLSDIQTRLEQDISELLEVPSPSNDGLKSITNARTFYASCMNTVAIEKDSLESLLGFIDGQLGGWPILKGQGWNASNFNLENILLRMSTHLMNPLFLIVTKINNANSSVYNILLGQGIPGLQQKERYMNETSITRAYRQFMTDVVSGLTNITSHIATDVNDMFQLEKSVAQYLWTPIDMINRAQENVRLPLNNVTQLINSTFDFSAFIRRLFLSAAVNLTDTQLVLVNQVDYLNNVSSIFSRASPRVLQNYLVWILVLNMIDSMPQRFQNMKMQLNQLLQGTSTEPARNIRCGKTVNDLMGFAVSKLYIEKYFDSKSRDQSLEVFSNIRDTFIDMIRLAPWMDDVSKSKAVEKAQLIVESIGYPEYVHGSNFTELENQYNEYNFNASYLYNTILAMRLTTKNLLKKIGQPTRRTTWEQAPTVINAFYNPPYNSIIFPAAILQTPAFNAEAPKYLNFGGIGAVMGHEITHGFDSTGGLYDKEGNEAIWWTNETIQAFVQKRQCIIDQYSNYTVAQVNLKIQGTLTEPENIADNGGLRAAFFAYQKWIQKNPNVDKRLPGLEKYSIEQLFFLNFGHFWCSKFTDSALTTLILTDQHSPNPYRVIGSTSNFAEFDRVFGCKPGQRNSRVNKCTIW